VNNVTRYSGTPTGGNLAADFRLGNASLVWWIGWSEEAPNALAQENTREELIQSLREVLAIMLEVNREQPSGMASPGYE